MQSGEYIISNTLAKVYVGPADTLEHPMRIVSFPAGVQAPRFSIEKLPHGYYLIKAKGLLTGAVNDLVVAIDDNPLGKEWIITPREDPAGLDVYTIEKAQGNLGGWVLHGPEADPTQLEPGTQAN